MRWIRDREIWNLGVADRRLVHRVAVGSGMGGVLQQGRGLSSSAGMSQAFERGLGFQNWQLELHLLTPL